jgi:hypothetical protein
MEYGMKKIFVLFFALIFSISSYSQKCGALSGNETWSANVHVTCDVTVGDGITLTISPGVVVSFDAGASLIINGSGILIADGTPANNITFTASNTTWGHLYFNNSTASVNSVINYCIIEKGNASGMSIPYGGGIHANTSKLAISNSSIRNNIAAWGGGVFVNKTFNPSISNCKIYLNTAILGGGGLYFWNNSSSIVTNCLIYKNSVSPSGSGGGGVIIGPSSGSVKIINCVIANNTAGNGIAPGIYIYTSNSAAIINSIIWGNPDQLSFYLTSTSVMQYCGIKGLSLSTCINLNSNNDLPDGPNFTDPTNDDYSIKFISPCRDAGTSTGAPLTDYLGNGRVGPYDIGAYEVQYSKWSGATSSDWTSGTNWDAGLVPIDGSSDIIIPLVLTNYPTGSTTLNYTIGAGHSMILNPGAKATLGILLNFGTLKLESDISNISSLIVTSFSKFDATIELFLTGGNPGVKLNKWHFISTPVTSLPVSTFAPTYTKNVVGWYDNQVAGTLASGWIAYNGYRYSTGIIDGPTFNFLTPGNGYDFYAATDQKYTFSGQLNTSNVPMSLSFSVNDALHGFNLLGNPFSSGLNWDDIINEVYIPYPASTSKSLYFTRDNTQCSYIAGVGIPSDVTGIIPPMQGFFVKTYSAGNILTIPSGARVHGAIHSRYKGAETIPLVRLSLAEGASTDETVVRFDAAAKPGMDYNFDAIKMFLSPDVLSIYSTSASANFAINGLPFPAPSIEIPILINLTASGTHTISATQLQGLDNYDVTLTDNTTGFVANLKTTPVLTFSGTTGTTANRFIMKVGTITTGIEDRIITKSTFNIYPANNNMINIQTMSDEWDGKTGSVRVLDLSGKTVSDQNNSEFSKNSLIQIESPGAKGIYFVEIKSGVLRYVGKVVIR